jgi:mono/diheme cytochrome c family protein
MGKAIIAAFGRSLVLGGVLGIQIAAAADLDNGKRLVETQCASCHFTTAHRLEVAPSFDAVVSRYGQNAQLIRHAIVENHSETDVTITGTDADDIAAYLRTLSN